MKKKTYMKANSFGQALSAFADLLVDAHAVEQADAWRTIVFVFQAAKPSKSVKDVCGALADIADHSLHSEAPTVPTLVRLVPAIRRCLEQGSKKSLIDSFNLFADTLSTLPSISITKLVEASVVRLSASTAARGREGGHEDGDVVMAYLARLEKALGDEASFLEVYGALKSDKAVKAADAKRLSRAFVKQRAASKADALDRIWDRHASLIGAGARVRAVGGRTAG